MEDAYEILEIPGAEDALLGLVERCGQPPFMLYDEAKLIEVFTQQGMTHEDAAEWVEVNIRGAWVGPATPAILTRLT